MHLSLSLLVVPVALAQLSCGGAAPSDEDPAGCAFDAHSSTPNEPPGRGAPTPGRAYRSCYGVRIQRLTDYAREGVSFLNAEYATQSHLNADASLAKLEFPDGRVQILRTSTREWLPGIALLKLQAPTWHPRESQTLLFWTGAAGGVEIRRLDVGSGASTVEFATDAFVQLDFLGESDISPDGDTMVFVGTTPAGRRHVFTYHRDARRLSHSVVDITHDDVNWVQVSNTRVLVGYNMSPGHCAPDIAEEQRFYADHGGPVLIGCQPLRIFDREMRPAFPGGRSLLAPYWGHGDVGLDAAGREIWVMANASMPVPRSDWFPGVLVTPTGCDNSPVKFSLEEPGPPTCLMHGEPALSWDLAFHVALPAVPSRWAYVSIVRPVGAGTVPFQDEIIRVRLDGSGFERLAHHHSSRFLPAAGGGSYYWQPRASVHSRGRYVLFNSNFGVGSDVSSDVYLLEVPGGSQ
jgi:hypothetical protein